jgi:hypothetical protein
MRFGLSRVFVTGFLLLGSASRAVPPAKKTEAPRASAAKPADSELKHVPTLAPVPTTPMPEPAPPPPLSPRPKTTPRSHP